MLWRVVCLAEAELERSALPKTGIATMINADAKLRSLGPSLGCPHSSDVRGEVGLNEFRPRGGRGPWRAFYRQIRAEFVAAAVGPEAQVDPQGFRRACQAAVQRLAEVEEG